MMNSIKRRLALLLSVAMILIGSEMAPVNIMASSADDRLTEETDILGNDGLLSGPEEILSDGGYTEADGDAGSDGAYTGAVTDDGAKDDIIAEGSGEGAITIHADTGASDGVVYYLERKTGDFEVGKKYIFVSGGTNKNYLTKVPDGSGILRIASWSRDERGWSEYISSSITAYVDVVRGTTGFDGCPHGTLNFSASEYSCYASGVQHQPGAAYDYNEYPYGSQVELTINRNGVRWDDADVFISGRNAGSKDPISHSNGVYKFGYVANDNYNVFVNGQIAGSIKVNAKPDSETVTPPGSGTTEGFYYITDNIFAETYNFHTMKARTYLNPDKDEEISGEPGEIMLLQGDSVYAKGSGEAERRFWGSNYNPYKIQVGSADTGHIVGGSDNAANGRSENDGAGDLETVNFYKMKVTVNSDKSYTSFQDADVSLRNDKGELVYVMNFDGSQSKDKTAVFTTILQSEESKPGTEKTYDEATGYRVYINGQDTHRIVKRVRRTDDMDEGVYPYEASVDYYTAMLSVKKDGTLWSEVSATLDNGIDHYAMNYNGSAKRYEADVLVSYYGNGTEMPYTLKVEGGTDTGAATQLKTSSKSASYEFYTLSYYSYKSDGKNPASYIVDTKPYRTQIVRKGSKTSAPSDAYIEGLSFCWYSTTKWNNGDAFPEFPYDSTPITKKMDLYAQFAQPSVKVGEFVAKSNTTFMLDNLTINGFGSTATAIKSVQIQTKNIGQVKFNNTSNITAKQGTGENLGSGNVATNSIINIVFNNGKSMAEAQTWLREQLVFTPVIGKTCEVRVVASDGILSDGNTDKPAQNQDTSALTKLDGSVNDLGSGFYYVNGNVNYSGTTGQAGALRIQSGATVRIYVPSGSRLNCYGAAGSGRTTGGGAGIYLPSDATLYLLGGGTVYAKAFL